MGKRDYFGESLDLYKKDDKRFIKVMRAFFKKELLYYKKSGLDKVEIIGSDNGCAECARLKGKVITVREALKTMPLPHKDCTFNLTDSNKYSWCRCCYAPAID